MQKRKYSSLRNKLLIRGRVILVLILMMIIASQIVVSILKRTSNEFFIEYHEMNAIQEMKLSLYQLLLQTNKQSLKNNIDDQTFFQILLHQTREKLKDCQNIITESHDYDILDEFPDRLNTIENLSFEYFESDIGNDSLEHLGIRESMNQEISEALKRIDIVLIETKIETERYYDINRTVFNHSSLAILSLGLIILFIFLLGGLRFINNLTEPIHDFVFTTKRIIKGERGIYVKIETNDEFSILADSFNKMLESLESTTVSKSYLDNILKNMFDSLIVTDKDLVIRSVNNSVSKLIGKPIGWFDGKHIKSLFGEEDVDWNNDSDLSYWKRHIENQNFLVHGNGNSIPALISCALLKNESGQEDGLVIVGHDLTVKKEIERRLEESRKQRQIDINEAEEQERMRIATDLHDGLGQKLTAISYSSQEFKNFESLSKYEKQLLIKKIQEQVNNAIKESKDLSRNLIPIVLKDFGLVAAIKNMIDKASNLYSIKFNFEAYDFNERINSKLEKALYRICQESLNNIIKHSNASEVDYQIFKQDEILVLVIDDNGDGFDIKKYEENKEKGIGLISMRERAQSFGGSFSVDSQLGKGTELIIEMPLNTGI